MFAIYIVEMHSGTTLKQYFLKHEKWKRHDASKQNYSTFLFVRILKNAKICDDKAFE